ncbi:MAG TPA: Tm-1-like ATP-binding domain-containing protein [Planctomycetota bacterium]|nr:Tm-1-like ATP-binding domain-containing protein [Planctomycetota bacterium]
MAKSVYAIATMDSKGDEIAYVARCARSAGASVVVVDVGTKDPATQKPDITREQVAAHHPKGAAAALGHTDRGQAVTAMSEALEVFLKKEFDAGKVSGVIAVGGSGGSALISPALRTLPIGFPKVLVSTMPGGNCAPYMGFCDFTMVHSVVDVAGLNRVSLKVLANAAHAIAGMAAQPVPEIEVKPTLALTMFGVTTPCVTAVRKKLEEQGYDCLIFHATGTGGQSMEKLVESGMIEGVLDITTTEVADEVGEGTLKAGPKRFDVIIEKGIPYVMSLGALDMINFGARESVPAKFNNRRFHVHNAQVTLMRTSIEDNIAAARFMAEKINRSHAPLILLIPQKGVSMLDAPGQAFYDPSANAALFGELERLIKQTPKRQIRKVPHHINDPEFAAAILDAYKEVSAR